MSKENKTTDTQVDIVPYQLCPKCLGEGKISTNGLSTSVFNQCDVCNGAKIIPQYVLPTTQPNNSTDEEKRHVFHSTDFSGKCFICGEQVFVREDDQAVKAALKQK